VSIQTGDELEELGDSFNTMVLGLKELEQLKDEFVFIAAHELRTPVAAMKGYLTLILEGQTGGVNDQTKLFIEKVLGSNQRLIQLVNDLLEVARSQAGRLTIKVAPTDLRPPLRSVFDELKSLADEKSIKMIYEPPDDLPNVLADADRIKEVGVNLVGNSIKYIGDDDTRGAARGTITITHEKKDRSIITRFADTGLGISKEAQARLFEKFYRVQTEKTRDITGTGLGLFIVKEIIEKMNGTISVESEEGKGTTFIMTLPMAQEN
jgi:signal transduction histidine kinase